MKKKQTSNYWVYTCKYEWGTQVTIIANDGLSYIRFHIDHDEPKTAHYSIVETHPSVRRQGRMKSIWQESEKVAKQLGCTGISGMCDKTSFIYHYYLKIGMQFVCNQDYNYVFLRKNI